MAKRSAFWSLTVRSADDAKKMVRESAMGFYTIAAIEAAVALLLGPSILLDAGLFAGLGIWLHRTNSRVAATLLLILAGISIVTTASNQFGGGQGGRNTVLAVIVFWIAIRAVFATYKLPALTREEALADVAG